MSLTENPRAVVGDNQAPDYAREVTERMGKEYAAAVVDVEKLLKEANELVATIRATETGKIEDDATSLRFSKVNKDLRDKSAALKAFHELEKAPFFRGGQGVDNFFFSLMEKLARRKETDKAGAADILYAFVDDFTQRKHAREQAERDKKLREAQDAAREAQRVREAEEARQREAEAAASRARKAETIEKHTEIATEAATKAADAEMVEQVARDQVSEAKIAANAAPADLVRIRSDEGVMNTMAREYYAEVEDVAKLDPKQLWPFIGDKEKTKALKAWAKITQYKTPMAGAIIGQRNKTKIV